MQKRLLLLILYISVQLAFAVVGEVEQTFIDAGLVNVSMYDKSIHVKLVNSNEKWNVFRHNFYGNMKKAYLQKPVAEKLAVAQKLLKKDHPNYSLLIMDAARPNSVSRVMFEQVRGTEFEVFVANPNTGSMHNYGAAVDITIIDSNGKLLDMGFNPFYRTKTGVMFSYGWSKLRKLSDKQKGNRELLKRVMTQAGFKPLKHEWWHFNGFSKSYIRKNFKMIK